MKKKTKSTKIFRQLPLALVEPLMNQSSSSVIPRRKVSSLSTVGKHCPWDWNAFGLQKAKSFPFRFGPFFVPVSMIRRHNSVWCSSCFHFTFSLKIFFEKLYRIRKIIENVNFSFSLVFSLSMFSAGRTWPISNSRATVWQSGHRMTDNAPKENYSSSNSEKWKYVENLEEEVWRVFDRAKQCHSWLMNTTGPLNTAF